MGNPPDTRGPYYQPEVWAESTRITKALRQVLDTSSSDEAGFLVREMNRNRVPSSAALDRILSLAQTDDRLLPELAAQLAQADPPQRSNSADHQVAQGPINRRHTSRACDRHHPQD